MIEHGLGDGVGDALGVGVGLGLGVGVAAPHVLTVRTSTMFVSLEPLYPVTTYIELPTGAPFVKECATLVLGPADHVFVAIS